MLPDFIYWPFITPAGIKLEIISAPCECSQKLWLSLAYQIYCENGRDYVREIGHFPSGAPFLHGCENRISISHTKGMLVVASLPRTPEATLIDYSQRTAMGVDVEADNREQADRCRNRYLNEKELELIPDNTQSNVLAWTLKEALYKAALHPGLDFRSNIIIKSLPTPYNPDNETFSNSFYGTAQINLPTGIEQFSLITLSIDGYIISIAFSPKCAKFKKNNLSKP